MRRRQQRLRGRAPPGIIKHLLLPVDESLEMLCRRRIRLDELLRESGRRRGDCEAILQQRLHDADAVDADDEVEDDRHDDDDGGDDDDPTKAKPSSLWRRPKKRAASSKAVERSTSSSSSASSSFRRCGSSSVPSKVESHGSCFVDGTIPSLRK